MSRRSRRVCGILFFNITNHSLIWIHFKNLRKGKIEIYKKLEIIVKHWFQVLFICNVVTAFACLFSYTRLSTHVIGKLELETKKNIRV